jgi:endonuclease/exonuclease/phosphatase family metal-dependent hydrolase
MGYRLDHILVRGLAVEACEYEHAWREAGLSDHSALWARLRVP